MPAHRTFPTIFDEVKTVSISFLTKHGYLKPNKWQSGTVTWSRNGIETGSISIQVNTHPESQYLELDYICNDAPVNYRVPLVTTPSNLGRGVAWFFMCPHTGKRCRKLHQVDTYFYHRTAFSGCLYASQALDKKRRYLDDALASLFHPNQLIEQLHKKNFKMHYAGTLTKRYLRILEAMHKELQMRQALTMRECMRHLLR